MAVCVGRYRHNRSDSLLKLCTFPLAGSRTLPASGNRHPRETAPETIVCHGVNVRYFPKAVPCKTIHEVCCRLRNCFERNVKITLLSYCYGTLSMECRSSLLSHNAAGHDRQQTDQFNNRSYVVGSKPRRLPEQLARCASGRVEHVARSATCSGKRQKRTMRPQAKYAVIESKRSV